MDRPQRLRCAWFTVVAIAVALLLADVRPARAKNCGGLNPPCGPGAVVCDCGDTVTSHYVLDTTLDCSAYGGSFGLKVASDVNLAVGASGVQIIGSGSANSVGILLDGVSGSTVIGRLNGNGTIDYLGVTGWERGVQLTNGASGNTIQYVEAFENGDGTTIGDYGIDLRLSGTTDNVIANVWVHDQADEGVHLGGGSSGNTVRDSIVENNGNTQIYLTGTSENSVLDNEVKGVTNGKDGIRLVSTSDSTIQGNSVTNADITFATGSSGNTVVDNTIHDGRMELGDSVNDNVVDALVVTGSADHCVEFSAGTTLPYANRVNGSTLSCTGTVREIISSGSGTSGGSQNLVCATTCIHSGSQRPCEDPGDTNDAKSIITLQTTACVP